MAEIRVERKGGSKIWLWVLLAVVVLVVAALLLARAGYIELPVDVGASDDPVSAVHMMLRAG